MTNIFTALLNDENGFLVSSELVLISTILIMGLVVGLTEVSFAVNNELEDVASAIGSVNQSFYANGIHSADKSCTAGSEFEDLADDCDGQFDIVSSGYIGERN
jgi:Flp pilus assembly pilin Flp